MLEPDDEDEEGCGDLLWTLLVGSSKGKGKEEED